MVGGKQSVLNNRDREGEGANKVNKGNENVANRKK